MHREWKITPPYDTPGITYMPNKAAVVATTGVSGHRPPIIQTPEFSKHPFQRPRGRAGNTPDILMD
jgi:hypothetical protein